jgi:oligoribonuclease
MNILSPYADKRAVPTKLVWIDLEMTGLADITKDRITEVGMIITDFEFNELASYESAIYHDESLLRERFELSDWFRAQDASYQAGSYAMSAGGKPEDAVRRDVAALIREHLGEEGATLAGNSIRSDRIFIDQWWPDVAQLLHYRMLDVSSYKVLWSGMGWSRYHGKAEHHRALSDIRESIAELQYYMRAIDPKKARGT